MAFNASQSGKKRVSLADLIVLGGCAAIEKAAKAAGHDVDGSLHAGPQRCHAGTDGCRELRGSRADRRWLPQLPEGHLHGVGGRAAGRQGPAAAADGAGNDRARRRHARPGRQCRHLAAGVFTKTPAR